MVPISAQPTRQQLMSILGPGVAEGYRATVQVHELSDNQPVLLTLNGKPVAFVQEFDEDDKQVSFQFRSDIHTGVTREGTAFCLPPSFSVDVPNVPSLGVLVNAVAEPLRGDRLLGALFDKMLPTLHASMCEGMPAATLINEEFEALVGKLNDLRVRLLDAAKDTV